MKIIRTEGSFRKMGRDVGEELRSVMIGVHAALEPQLLAHPAFPDREALKRAVSLWASMSVMNAADSGDWLLGLAEGAGSGRPETCIGYICMTAFSEELMAMAARPREKCSTLVVPGDKGMIVGHNEDYPTAFGPLFVLDMRPDGCPRTVSLNYPGQLPGLAGSLNKNGFCITHNSLPGDAVIGSPPLMTTLMRANHARSWSDAIDVFIDTPHAISGHFFLTEKHSASVRVSTERTLLGPFSDASCHTNHVVGGPEGSQSSRNRLAKLQALIKDGPLPGTPEAMLAYLTRPDGVLLKPIGADPESATLATVVMRPQTREFWAQGHLPGDELIHVTL